MGLWPLNRYFGAVVLNRKFIMEVTESCFWEDQLLPKEVDLVVIGAGLVGLQTALAAKRSSPGLSILVIDKCYAGLGASTRNAGFACFGSPGELLADLEQRSLEQVIGLVERRMKGLERLLANVGDPTLLAFRSCPAYELFPEEAAYQEALDKLDMLNQALFPAAQRVVFKDNLDRYNRGVLAAGMKAIKIIGEGQLHPGRLMRLLRKMVEDAGIQLAYGLEAKGLETEGDGVRIHLKGQRALKAKCAVIAVNGFLTALASQENDSVKPGRGQVLLSEPMETPLDGNFHVHKGYFYLRNVGDRLLIGGGRHLDMEGEATTKLEGNAEIETALTNLSQALLAQSQPLRFSHKWSGIMGFPTLREPKVEVKDNLVIASGLAGMGVALSASMASEAAEACLSTLA